MATVNKVGDTTKPYLLSIDVVAARLSLSSWTIRAMIRDGRLASCKIATRVLVPASELARLIDAGSRRALPEADEAVTTA